MRFRNDDGTIDLASVLGAVMIAVGAILLTRTVLIYRDILGIEFLLVYSDLPGRILMIAGGLLILSMRDKGYGPRIAVAGIVLGTAVLLDNIFFTDFYEYSSFIVGIVSFMIGVMAIVSSASLLCGYSHHATRLSQCVLVMVLIELYPIWYYYSLYMPWSDILSMCYDCLLTIVVYAVMLACLRHESVRIMPAAGRIERDTGIIEDAFLSGSDAFMTPEDAMSLKRFVEEKRDGRMDVRLHRGTVDGILSVSSAEGSFPKASVKRDDRTEILNVFVFEIHALAYDGGELLRIYGRTGMFVQIKVRPDER